MEPASPSHTAPPLGERRLGGWRRGPQQACCSRCKPGGVPRAKLASCDPGKASLSSDGPHGVRNLGEWESSTGLAKSDVPRAQPGTLSWALMHRPDSATLTHVHFLEPWWYASEP